MTRAPADSGASLFGKVPARGDFFHTGPHGSAELAFATWLSSAIEQNEGALPIAPVRFLVAPPDDSTLVGTWVSSRDHVGRNFPLAVSCRVPEDVEHVQWSLVLGYYGGFLLEAERELERAADADMERLEQARRALPLPHPSELPGLLQQARSTLASETVLAFARRNFQGDSLDALAYALGTLLRAVALADEQLSLAPVSARLDLTLDMPVRAEHDVFAWLELLAACFGPERKPYSLLWAPRSARLLVGLGTASTQQLAFLTRDNHRSHRRWPLWTNSPEAAAAVRRELHSSLARALQDDLSIAALIELVRALPAAGAPP